MPPAAGVSINEFSAPSPTSVMENIFKTTDLTKVLSNESIKYNKSISTIKIHNSHKCAEVSETRDHVWP